MRLLDRHIGSYVVRGTLLSLLVLVGLFTLTEFVEDLGSVGKGAYTMPRAAEYMLFKLRQIQELSYPKLDTTGLAPESVAERIGSMVAEHMG